MNPERVSAAEARRLLIEQGYVYLDVRSEEEFALGHPAGAYNVPWLVRDPHGDGLLPNPDFDRVLRACFEHAQAIVIGCERGDRSRAALSRLAEQGYRDLVELRPGYAGIRDAFGRLLEHGWRSEGLPCEVQSEPGRDYAALLARAR